MYIHFKYMQMFIVHTTLYQIMLTDPINEVDISQPFMTYTDDDL